MTNEIASSIQDISYKYKFSILVAIVFLCVSRVILQGSGVENELYRYFMPLMTGGLIGYYIGYLHDNWHQSLLISRNTESKYKRTIEEQNILQGIIPICAHCRQIRDDTGDWGQIEEYIQRHSEVSFSHGLCPTCAEEHYPSLY